MHFSVKDSIVSGIFFVLAIVIDGLFHLSFAIIFRYKVYCFISIASRYATSFFLSCRTKYERTIDTIGENVATEISLVNRFNMMLNIDVATNI